MSAAMYDHAVRLFTLGGLDWEHDTVKVLLATDSYQPDQRADQSRADIHLAEVAPNGTYRSGGEQLTGRRVEMDAPNEVRLTGGSVEWRDFTGEFRYAVVYQASGGDQRDQDSLIAYTDLGYQEVRNARVALDFDAVGGVCAFSVAAA